MHVDAKTFISNKYSAAVEELRSLEAEYGLKMEAAKARIALTEKWMKELGSEAVAPEPAPVVEPEAKDDLDPVSEHLAELREDVKDAESPIEEPTVPSAMASFAEEVREKPKRSPVTWISSRDLRPNVRQAT